MSVISASGACWRSTSAARKPAGPAPTMTSFSGMTPTIVYAEGRTIWQRSHRSLQMHILVFDREIVDAAVGRGDPGGHLAGLDDLMHQALDEGAVALGREPCADAAVPFLAADDPALGRHMHACPSADRSAKAGARQGELAPDPGFLDHPVPALYADLAIPDIGAAHRLVHAIAKRKCLADDPAPSIRHLDRRGGVACDVVLVLALVGPALEAAREVTRGVRGRLRAEEIERGAEPEIQVPLERRQVDGARLANGLGIVGRQL